MVSPRGTTLPLKYRGKNRASTESSKGGLPRPRRFPSTAWELSAVADVVRYFLSDHHGGYIGVGADAVRHYGGVHHP